MTNYKFTVLLSASVPSEKRSKKYRETYTKIENAQIQIEEAIIGLCRNVFQAKGRMIFGGHPSISPLVAMVATEFDINKEIEDIKRNEPGEKRINIYQSKVFEEVIPKQTTTLFNLGYSDIIWTEAVNGEKYNPDIKDTPQCEDSLAFMRKQMISNKIDALVCIGGMEGVEKEFDLFRKIHPTKPVFVLKSTGGASKFLAEESSQLSYVSVIDNIDYLFYELNKEDKSSKKIDIIPYSYFTALIVKQILDSVNS